MTASARAPAQTAKPRRGTARTLRLGPIVVHVNSIESFWSLLERVYVGTFHKLSKKWLPAYVDEFAFRFSHTRCSNGVGLWKTLLSNGLRHSQKSEG